MSLFWFEFSDLLPTVAVDLEDSDVPSGLSGFSLVTVISKPFGSDDMIPVLQIVNVKDP